MLNEKIITLAGNPNVGKSTVFNTLTGLKQHTGNWAGKTVTNAKGYLKNSDEKYVIMDIPGLYSLVSSSKDEEVASDFICFEDTEKIVIVCDATSIERNLLIVIQTLEVRKNVVLCINLLDEAKNNGININLQKIGEYLDVEVVGVTATKKEGIPTLIQNIKNNKKCSNYNIKYDDTIENVINIAEKSLLNVDTKSINKRWICLKLLEGDKNTLYKIQNYINYNLLSDEKITNEVDVAKKILIEKNINLSNSISKTIYNEASKIMENCVDYKNKNYYEKTLKIDKILTSKLIGLPIMFCLLALIFWITIVFANYPSTILSETFFYFEQPIKNILKFLKIPPIIISILIDGIYKVVSWVVAVMLPPMAIFFPMFTILEDLGYLPRIAFSMDKIFKKCNACGKQALTMCMGFGCNACGVTGARIIESDRERLIAILTNSFVPCNGRFPTLISIISMFFIGTSFGIFNSFMSSLILTGIVFLGIGATFISSFVLSKTILKGMNSNFTLELPPYRKPQVFNTIIRSIFDKTIFILARALVVSLPAGVVIWIMANTHIDGNTILFTITNFLDNIAKYIGLDGVILMAFIFGFPANEIVFPIIVMSYLGANTLLEFDNLVDLKALLIQNGWTIKTAICTAIFCLFHWPCSTTCITVYKETKSLKWSLLSFFLPTLFGLTICFLLNIII